MPLATPSGKRRTAPAGLRETRAARVALALIALYVLDDNFVHPEPGTGVGDHLASGLVPLAVLLALALAYPRLRAGLRALVALGCGSLAIVAGIADGFRHIEVDTLSGDDASAVVAFLAGAALIALGTDTLWRSRRLDEPRPRRYGRRAATGAAALVLAFMVVLPVGIAITVTHKARSPVRAANLGRPYERVSFGTSDGLRLAGWYVPSRNGAAVIAFPGRVGPVPHARMLARRGYGVLLFDRRGEGESEGDYNARGWNGERDLIAAVDFLRRRPDVDPGRIGGLGLSVGGELLLQAAAHDPALRAVVSEGAGTRSLAEQLDREDIPAWQRPFSTMAVETAADAVLAGSGPPPDLADLMPRIAPRPVLLIRALGGNEDEILNRVYYAAARPPKQLWEVSEGGHTGALEAAPAEYRRRVLHFFDSALLGRR